MQLPSYQLSFSQFVSNLIGWIGDMDGFRWEFISSEVHPNRNLGETNKSMQYLPLAKAKGKGLFWIW